MHQSTSPVYLDCENTKPIPIYCVTSNHSLDVYEWDQVDIKIPGNSPVMWVNVPGVYRCKNIRDGFTCTFKVMNVEMKNLYGS